jgi:PhzF family phenazine biosynthesis protein
VRLPLFQLDAFAERVFTGNPAAVCPLETWLDDALLQAVAAENNLSETAFVVRREPREGADYEIRWFTPATEVDLCGHATLASAEVVLGTLEPGRERVRFHSRSGPLDVARRGDLLELDFPARPPQCLEAGLPGLAEALGVAPLEVWQARDVMAVLADEEQVRGLRPDLARVAALPTFAVIVTAAGREADFVSRFFAPAKGVPEDPVTGSAHCTLVPYWARRLGRERLRARQVSARGGELLCELRGDRVALAGRVARYLEGFVEVPGRR